MDKKAHWENVFGTKAETEVSWYQKKPETSIDFLEKLNISKSSKIIDVGGGDSYFIDYLVSNGFTDITLMDISAKAIERIKSRLGDKAKDVKFIISDVMDFIPEDKYDFWHDRASFHFLTDENQIVNYASIASQSISEEGKMVIGTFSESGPKKCSGLEITQYNKEKMYAVFEKNFELIECFHQDHLTPFDTTQNFIFCSFNKK